MSIDAQLEHLWQDYDVNLEQGAVFTETTRNSSKMVSSSGGGVEDPPCFNIGYSRSARAESREGSSTPEFAWVRL